MIELREDLYALEQERRKVFARVVETGCVLAGIVGVVLLVIAWRVPELVAEGMGFVAVVVVLVGVLIFWLTKRYGADYKRRFKDRIIGRIVRFVDEGLAYYPTRCISRSVYMLSGLYKTKPDRYRGDDLVTGKVGDTSIEFSEIHSEYKSRDSKGNTHWHTIFRGLFFIGDFNKQFKGNTYVLPDVAERAFGWLGQKLQELNPTREELIKLEDPEFEKYFVVYGDSQIEARYILSPSLMRRIVAFKRKTRSEIRLSFVGSKVYVAVPFERKLFEPSLVKTILDTELLEDYFEDLQLAIGIVEDLNLNTRIWSKR